MTDLREKIAEIISSHTSVRRRTSIYETSEQVADAILDLIQKEQNAHISELKGALKPFANVAQKVLELTDDHWDAYVTLNGTDSIKSFHRDVFRNASRALGGKDND